MSQDQETAENVLKALRKRVSFPRLEAPAPKSDELEEILMPATRAPDHMMLRPARYLIVEGDALLKLGAIFESAKRMVQTDCNEMQYEKYRNMPMRAPMILVAVSKNIEHPKVPKHEQEQSVASGLAYILLALQAKGYGAIWRTGDMAENIHVKTELGIAAHESLVGFLYIGTPCGEPKPIPEAQFSDYFSYWS
jgi:nitroreductase